MTSVVDVLMRLLVTRDSSGGCPMRVLVTCDFCGGCPNAGTGDT